MIPIVGFCLAFALTLIFTPLVKKVAIRLSIVDIPNTDVKTHTN